MAIGGSGRFVGCGPGPPGGNRHRQQDDPLLQWKLAVVDDVEVKYLQTQLLSQQLVSWREWEDIYATRKQQDGARLVLDLLERKGKNAYARFATVLQQDYDWLSTELVEVLEDPKNDRYFEELNGAACHHSVEVPDSAFIGGAVEVDWRSRIHGAPVPPTTLITRPVVTEIRQRLDRMKQNEFLALYAMPGAGKSIIALDVINAEDLVRRTFPGGIYWVNVGKVDEETLLAKMQTVYERLASDGDDSIRQPFPVSVEAGQYRLRKLVESKSVPMLLVLDDVWSPRTLLAFEIGCRVLLTCRDSSVTKMLGKRANLEPIAPGFDLDESLELLSKMTGIEQSQLPSEAVEMHHEARGVPMVISLMGGILAGNQRPKKWSIYLDKYKKGQMDQFKMDASEKSIFDAVALSYEALDEQLQEKYKVLAVFSNDAIFSSEALCALWSSPSATDQSKTMDQSGLSSGCYGIMGECEDPTDTDLLADVFVKKSLLNSFFERDTYMYFLHNLQHRFLQKKIGADERQELHRKLLKWYFQLENSGGGKKNRLADQYFLWNVGHHLRESNCLHWFPMLYLDLDFVAQKIAVTGPSDLLNDYQKYKVHIDNEEIDLDLDVVKKQTRKDFENFVRINSHQLLQKDVDILQLGLSMPQTSAVFAKAREAVGKRKSKLYFECCNDRNHDSLLMTKLHANAVTCCIFVPTLDCVVAGDAAGNIRVWDSRSGTEIMHWQACEANSHVTCMQLIEVKSIPDSPATPPPYLHSRHQTQSKNFMVSFVSAGTDGIARVWQVIYDASTAADEAASANKRRSRHLSANQVHGTASFPGSPGIQHAEQQERPVSWAPDSTSGRVHDSMAGGKSRSGSISSISSLMTTPSASSFSLNQLGVPHVSGGSSKCTCIAQFNAHRGQSETQLAQQQHGPSQQPAGNIAVLTSAVHPNKSHLATGDSVGTVRIWRAETGREEAVLVAAKLSMDGGSRITACSFSLETNSQIMATGNEHAIIRLWNFVEQKLLYTFGSHRLTVIGIHFVNESEIVSVSQTSIIQWNFKQALKRATQSNKLEERSLVEALIDAETDALPIGRLQPDYKNQVKDVRVAVVRRTSSARRENGRGTANLDRRAGRRLTQTPVLSAGGAMGRGSLVEPGGMEFIPPTKSIYLTSDLSPCRRYLVVGTEKKGVALWEVGKPRCCGFQRPHVGRVELVRFGLPYSNNLYHPRLAPSYKLLLLSGSKVTTILHDVQNMTGDSLALSPNFEAAWHQNYGSKADNHVSHSNLTMTILDWESKAHFFQGHHSKASTEQVFRLENKKEVQLPESSEMKVTCMAVAGREQVVLGTAEGHVLLACKGEKAEELHMRHAGPVLCVAAEPGINKALTDLFVVSGSVGFVHMMASQKSWKIKFPGCTIHSVRVIHPYNKKNEGSQVSAEVLVATLQSTPGLDSQPLLEFLVYGLPGGQLLRKIGQFPSYMVAPEGESAAGWNRCYFSLGSFGVNETWKALFDCNANSDRFAICIEQRVVRLSTWSDGEQLHQLRLKSMWNEAKDKVAMTNLTNNPEISNNLAEIRHLGSTPLDANGNLPSTVSTAINAADGRPTNKATMDMAISAFALSSSLRKLSVSTQLRLTAIKFSPSGRLLATGDSTGSVRVWSTANFRALCCLQARSFDPVYDIALSTCDRLLVAAGGANKLAWWSLDHVDPSLLTSMSSLTPTSPSSDSEEGMQCFRNLPMADAFSNSRAGKKKDSGPRPKFTVRQGSFETDEDDEEQPSQGHDSVAFAGLLRFGLLMDSASKPSFSLDVDEEATPTPSPANSLEIAQRDLARIVASLKHFAENHPVETQRHRRRGHHPLPSTTSLGVNNRNHLPQKVEENTSAASVGACYKKCDSCQSILHAKKGRKKNPALLQVFQVSNGPVRRIVASPNFDEFVTVDDAGSVYLLKAIGSKL